MTNADKIRSMTDEELAVIIMCPYDMSVGECYEEKLCVQCCLKWLQSESEVGE